jgi:hemerythrin-like domain-containing protein
MREHGLLNRILIIYDDSARKLDASESIDVRRISDAAGIIKRFIEEYHEKLEEDFLFARFQNAGKHMDLVAVLRAQHEAGRRLTSEILALATPAAGTESTRKLAADLRLFTRMYRPHEAREDTILFPALHEIVSAQEYDALGEAFEKKEHELFGKEGFEGMVQRTAELEKALGLYDLRQFTP